MGAVINIEITGLHGRFNVGRNSIYVIKLLQIIIIIIIIIKTADNW
jgi:hypothetical protein